MFGTLQITEKDLTLSNKLGDGAFASVYRYVDPVSKKTYAIKCFKADVSLEVVKAEIEINETISKLIPSHPSIIKYYGC